MAQFKTDRMSDNTLLKDVDDRVNDLESAIVYYFNLVTGQDLAGKILQSDVDGNLTAPFRSAAAPSVNNSTGPGWRFRDTTSGDEFMLMARAGYLRVLKNVGSQASPTWSEINKMSLATGNWDLMASGSIGSGAMVYNPYSSGIVNGNLVPWTLESYDDDNYWSTAARSRLIIPVDGWYRFHWNIYYQVLESESDVSVMTCLYKNGLPLEDSLVGSGALSTTYPGYGPGSSGSMVSGAAAADYFELYMYVENGAAFTAVAGHFIVERIR